MAKDLVDLIDRASCERVSASNERQVVLPITMGNRRVDEIATCIFLGVMRERLSEGTATCQHPFNATGDHYVTALMLADYFELVPVSPNETGVSPEFFWSNESDPDAFVQKEPLEIF